MATVGSRRLLLIHDGYRTARALYWRANTIKAATVTTSVTRDRVA
jgi:hypothetical protein